MDFDLCGMLGNFLYSGHYQLPAAHARFNEWHRRMSKFNQTVCRTVKNYILDTNVLLHDPNSLLSFEDNNVLIPIEVIEEIDRFKRESTELGQNARTVSRMLDGFRGEGSLSEGVKLPNGGKLRIVFHKNGHRQRRRRLQRQHRGQPDPVARRSASRRRSPKTRPSSSARTSTCASRPTRSGLQAEDYETDRVFITDLYTGMMEMSVSPDKMAAFRAKGELELNGGKTIFPERILHAHRRNQSQAHRADQGGPDRHEAGSHH